MISVLIPVYNYEIVGLVTQLNEQLQLSNISFEIICLDDGSDKNIIEINQSIIKLEHSTYKVAQKNIGRTKVRQQLAQMAQYDWLLFLDADVIPKSTNFISTYAEHINAKYEVINGGIAYYDKKPESNFLLRWKYGRQQEQRTASFRNKKPYKIITSGNFIIKKDLFLLLNSKIDQNTYGLDNIFGAQLKFNKASILHINNEVYHLGLENNTTYLKKKEDSALTVLDHYKARKVTEHQNDLLHLFIKLKRFKINYLFVYIYKTFGGVLRRNLLGHNPSIKLLQLYRISFMCYKDLQSKDS